MSLEMPKFKEQDDRRKFFPKEQPKPIELPNKYLEEITKFKEAGISEQEANEIIKIIGKEFTEQFPGTGYFDGSASFVSLIEVRPVEWAKDISNQYGQQAEVTIIVKRGTDVYMDGIDNWEVKMKKVDGVWQLEKAVEK